MLKDTFWRSVSKWLKEWTIWRQYEYYIEICQREIACELCPDWDDQEEWEW